MAVNIDGQHHTRSATRTGVYPPPPPIFPGLSFGDIPAGELTPLYDGGEERPTVASATRPIGAPALADTSVSRYPPSASRAGEISMSLPSLKGEVDFGTPEKGSASAGNDYEDGGWTTVTRKTSRSHREHSRSSRGSRDSGHSESGDSDTESTIAQATNELSAEDAINLAHRYEAYAAQLRAGAGGKTAPLAAEGGNNVQPDVQEHRGKTLVPEGSNDEPKPLTSTSCRATVEEVEDDDDLISFSPKAGPSRNKGKGLDPGNWGDVSSLHDFDEQELRAQREMLENYAEINPIIKQEETSVVAKGGDPETFSKS
ncbi:hypothetical protein B0H14DRAFT_2639456 [Mycena olivaceomarginata]|nr:hypothetical protein B0H14DRAFT_2639456 [Mycena olivaceomarginata]